MYNGGVNNIALAPGSAVFNEGGVDVDFRVESDDNANAFVVDGGNDNVGIGAVPSSALALTVKPVSVLSSLSVQNTTSGSRLEGSVWMSPQNSNSEGSQGSMACLLHQTLGNRSEIRIDFTTDSFRGGPSGTYWVTMAIGDQSTIGAGWLSVLKPQNGNWVMYWDQVVSHGTNPTITLTTTTANTTVLDGHLRIANTSHTYSAFSINKLSGGGGNGGDTPLFTIHEI